MTPEEQTILSSGKSLDEINLELSRIESKLKVYSVEEGKKRQELRATQRNPEYPAGDNRTRNEFIFSPYEHPKGKFFQNIKSGIMIKAINFAHSAILKGYDMDAYVYDDPRLKAQNEFFREYIQENFRHVAYKTEFMNKIVDIIMFLVKEDIYYRRLMDMLNRRPYFELTKDEQENIEKWH